MTSQTKLIEKLFQPNKTDAKPSFQQKKQRDRGWCRPERRPAAFSRGTNQAVHLVMTETASHPAIDSRGVGSLTGVADGEGGVGHFKIVDPIPSIVLNMGEVSVIIRTTFELRASATGTTGLSQVTGTEICIVIQTGRPSPWTREALLLLHRLQS